MELRLGLDGERFDLLELADDEGIFVRIAEQAHRQDRVRHRRIDATEPARHQETLFQPEPGRLQGAPAERAGREALPDLEAVIDGDEKALPEEAAPRERLRHARKP